MEKHKEKKYKDEEGNVSIFAIITFTAIILLLFALLDFLRIQKSKNDLRRDTLLSIESVFAGYNRELKTEYGLFGIRDQEDFEIEDSLKKFIDNNIDKNNLGRIKIEEVRVNDEITLANEDELKRQIVKYMECRYLDLATDGIKKLSNFKEGYKAVNEEAQKIHNEKISPVSEDEYEDIENYKNYDNRKEVEAKINEDIKQDDRSIPDEIFDNWNKYKNESKEKNKRKIEIEKAKEEADEIISNIEKDTLIDDILVNEYIFLKFNNSLSKSEFRDRFLKSEIEYIIGGNKSQNENLKLVKNKITIIRFPVRLSDVYKNKQKRIQAETAAQAIAGWWATEIGVTIVKNSLLAAMALDIANEDSLKVMNGEKIEIYEGSNIYFEYEDFLRIIIYSMNENEKLNRITNLMDLNIKNINNIFDIRKVKTKIKVKIKASEKFIFMTRRCIPKPYRRNDEVEIHEEISYGY